jgi:polyhydroxyalkanoate synthesis regulator phasin
MSTNETKKSPLFEASRKVLLAAVGAAALAQDEAEDFIDRLVERGEIAEREATDLVKEVVERRRKTEAKRRTSREKTAAEAVTREDIEALTKKIAEMSRQIESLKEKAAK